MINNIFINLTHKCNAFCKKCMTRYSFKIDQEMSIDNIDRIFYLLKKENYNGMISVGSGESLTYQHLNYFIKKVLDSENIKLRILTNGKLLTKALPDYFFNKRIKWGITMDGFYNTTIKEVQEGINIDDVKFNIETLSKMYGGDFCYLNYTLYNNNVDHLIPFVQFACDNNIKEIYCTELKIYQTFEKSMNDYRVQHTSKINDIISSAQSILRKNGFFDGGLDIFKNCIKNKCYLMNKVSPIIDVDGAVSFCSGREDVDIGNINDDDIINRWLNMRDKVDNMDWCSLCHGNKLDDGTYSLPKNNRNGK